MAPESRLTDSRCQNASIRHMYISVRKSERTHVYAHAHTNTKVKTTVSHLKFSPRHQPILSATTLENTQHTLIYLFNFSDWWFFLFPFSPFKQITLTFYISVFFFFNILSNLSVKLIFKRLILKNLYKAFVDWLVSKDAKSLHIMVDAVSSQH